MNPRLRTTLGAIAASLVAAYLGWKIADGAYGLPALLAVLTIGAVVLRLTRLPVDTVALGLLLAGYVIGNRGFAQLMPYPGIPLLPAEIGLGLAVGWRGLRCAFERRLPFRRDPMNWAVLAWLVAGTARVAFDAPTYGILALRDYAVVYYAVFFFIAQEMGSDPRIQRYLRTCLLAACVVFLPLFFLTQLFPSFFLNTLTFRGNPVIFYKGDLAATFLAVGSLMLFHWAHGPHVLWARGLAAVMFLAVAAGDNRASLLAAGFACLVLLAARRWRYPALQGAVTAVAVLAIVVLAGAFNQDWARGKLEGLTDRLSSLVDFSGTGRYVSEESNFKGDNNRFRSVWWRTVARETWDTNPVFGLGFGTDIARNFVGEYFPDAGEDFTARSPHSVFMTAFGRMGFAGLAVWLVFCVVLAQETWRVLRRTEEPENWALWCSAWVILVSASFGVVLESPMGAVLFWTLIGLGHAATLPRPAASGDRGRETGDRKELAEAASR
jgi:hypothetical protein